MPGGNDCAARHRLAACLTPSGLARRAPCACRPLPLSVCLVWAVLMRRQAGNQPVPATVCSAPVTTASFLSAASGLAALASTASVTTSRTRALETWLK